MKLGFFFQGFFSGVERAKRAKPFYPLAEINPLPQSHKALLRSQIRGTLLRRY